MEIQLKDKKENLIISIKEARKLLGEESKHYSDDEIKALIRELTLVSKILFDW